MNEETDNQQPSPVNQPANNQDSGIVPPPRPGGERVIQPSEAMMQEVQAQQQPQPTVQLTPNPQPAVSPNPTNVYPEPTSGQMQIGMSASQMGLNEPKNKLFDFNNPKKLLIKGLAAILLLGGIFAALVATNLVPLNEFKTTTYVNDKGTQFKIAFYAKHTTKELKSGNKQLVSKVSKAGKFPLAVSISTSSGTTGYNRTKDCSSFTKVLDVQNNNLNQKISICDVGKQAAGQTDGLYIAAFMHDNQAHIITIGQDYSDIDLSSQSGAKESLTRFGMEPYKEDIEKIVASIKVE